MKPNTENSTREGGAQLTSTRSWKSIIALLMVFGLVAAACGSDDETDDTSSDASPETTAQAAEDDSTDETAEDAGDESTDEMADESTGEATGDPILVMVAGTIESPVFSVPSTPVGAQIAVDQINESGGINGRPLEMIVCNDEFDPNKAAACIQSAGQEGAVALVGGLTVFEPLLYPLLEAEGIAWVAPSPSVMLDSPMIFPISDGVMNFAAIGARAVRAGCETPAIIISANGSPANSANIRAGIEAFGGTVSADLQAAGPDFAPLVESAIADGADCFASGLSPEELPGLLSATAGRLKVATVDGPLPVQLLEALDGAADGMLIVSGYRLPAAGDPEVLALQEISNEVAPGVGMDQFWFNGYAGMNLVAEALKGTDDPSAETLIAGLKGITSFDTGFGPIVDFSSPNPVAALASIYNPNAYSWEIVDGAYTLVEDDPFSVQPAIDLLGQG